MNIILNVRWYQCGFWVWGTFSIKYGFHSRCCWFCLCNVTLCATSDAYSRLVFDQIHQIRKYFTPEINLTVWGWYLQIICTRSVGSNHQPTSPITLYSIKEESILSLWGDHLHLHRENVYTFHSAHSERLMTYNCELPSPRNLGAGGWSVSGEIRGWTFMIMGYPIIMAILRSGVTKPKIKQFIIGQWRGEESSKIPIPDYRGYLLGAERQVGYAGHAVIKYLVANFQLQRHRMVVRGECKGPLEWIQQWLTHKYMSHRVFALPLVVQILKIIGC